MAIEFNNIAILRYLCKIKRSQLCWSGLKILQQFDNLIQNEKYNFHEKKKNNFLHVLLLKIIHGNSVWLPINLRHRQFTDE